MRIQTKKPETSASALLVAVVMSGILGITLAAFLKLSIQDVGLTARSESWNMSIPVAEAGIEEGLTHCYLNFQGNLATNNWLLQNGAYVKTNEVYVKPNGNLHGADEGYYVVRISQTQPFTITSTGYSPIRGTGGYLSRTIQITTTNQGVFSGVMSVRDWVLMGGNTLYADSFDSRDTNKSSSGLYDPAKAGDKADIYLTEGLIDSVDVGNAEIWGHIYTGPLGTVKTGSQGKIGGIDWQRNTSVKNGIQPGWWRDDFNAIMPPVSPPFNSAGAPGSGTVNGTNFNYVLDNGNYMLTGIGGGKICVRGRATLYVTGSLVLDGNSDLIHLEEGATLDIYVGGEQSRLGAVQTPRPQPQNLKVFGLPGNTYVKLNGSRDFYGLVYAPSATLEIKGGVHYHGSLVSKTARLGGSVNLHYDEALSEIQPFRGFFITSWREL